MRFNDDLPLVESFLSGGGREASRVGAAETPAHLRPRASVLFYLASLDPVSHKALRMIYVVSKLFTQFLIGHSVIYPGIYTCSPVILR
jgi:hypothetical protein